VDALLPPVEPGTDLLQSVTGDREHRTAPRHAAGLEIPLPRRFARGMADQTAALGEARRYGTAGVPPGAGEVAGVLLFQISR
jgi:hypothetical protein